MNRKRKNSARASYQESILLRDYATTVTILEHISDAIFILDASGKIEYANKMALDILRIDLNNLIGRHILEFLTIDINQPGPKHHSHLPGNKFQNLFSQISQGLFNEIETTLVREGRTTPVLVGLGVIENTSKEVKYIIVSAKDISIRSQLDKELKHKQELAISNHRMRTLGELAIGLVHELSQPLASLKLKFELMQQSLAKPQIDIASIADNLDFISNLIDDLSATINNIRHFAIQVEDDSLQLLNVENCIENSFSFLAHEILDRKAKITLNTEKEIPLVCANPLALEQVFITIIKYIWSLHDQWDHREKAARKEIIITLAPHEEKWLEIVIEDNNNKTVRSSQLKKFSKFFSNHEIDLLTGIELSAIGSIITSIGGDVRVDCDHNRGSRFLIRIPVDQQDERDQLYNLIELQNM